MNLCLIKKNNIEKVENLCMHLYLLVLRTMIFFIVLKDHNISDKTKINKTFQQKYPL